jgi:hypothetical protein
MTGAAISVLIWARGVDRYHEQQVANATNSAPQQVPQVDRYRSLRGNGFRIDTLSEELQKAGLMPQPFDGISQPQARPTPENDTNPAEYFLLRNGLYLRVTRPAGGTITQAAD